MSESIQGLYVAFEENADEGSPFMENIIMALKMMKNVIDVKPIVEDHDAWIARTRIHRETREKLFAFIDKEFPFS